MFSAFAHMKYYLRLHYNEVVVLHQKLIEIIALVDTLAVSRGIDGNTIRLIWVAGIAMPAS